MFLPPRVVKLGKAELEVPGSTAALEVPQFSDYVERVQAWAANEFGCRRDLPQPLAPEPAS
jgi:hypothetical protein